MDTLKILSSYSLELLGFGAILLGASSFLHFRKRKRDHLESLTTLGSVIKRLAQEGDYSVKIRAEGYTPEVKELVEATNILIQQIALRDKRLIEYKLNLENLVVERSEQILKMNDELRKAILEATDANKAKSVFLANMSHELRTPLTTITLYTDILHNKVNDKLATIVGKIQNASNHLLRLIDDILDLSNIEQGKLNIEISVVNLTEVLPELQMLVDPLAQKNQNKFKLFNEGSTKLQTDPKKLTQVLYNLLENACKFTSCGQVSLEVKEFENYVLFEVADTGIGMTPEQVKVVFQDFTQADSTTSKKYGGTGLGLALVKKYTDMLHGSVSVDSELDKGTIFRLIFPIQFERGL
jgi:signal transduction histidine kinase